MLIGVFCAVTGVLLSHMFDLPSGPSIVPSPRPSFSWRSVAPSDCIACIRNNRRWVDLTLRRPLVMQVE